MAVRGRPREKIGGPREEDRYDPDRCICGSTARLKLGIITPFHQHRAYILEAL